MSPFVTLTASAQTQIVGATPGYVNLGMTTSVAVTAPASGSYTVVVQKPSGAESSADLTFTAGGQTQNVTYGNATTGFQSVIDQVGTYNVFVEQGSQVVGSTSFYATNRLIITMDMVTAGTCIFVQGISRGEQFIPRFYAHYASNDAPLTASIKGASINFTTPSGQVDNAPWDSYSSLFDNAVSPNWNYTFVGSWNPEVNASDGYGNFGTFTYTGSPFVITPAQLSTSIVLVDTATGHNLTSLASGEGMTIMATVTYPTNAEPVSGFVGPLSPARGGAVTAELGWGYYNSTSGTFGGGKTQGASLGTVPLTYSGHNGTWTGQFQSASLPTLPAGATYELVVSSTDGASPANEGFAMAQIAPAVAGGSVTQTQTVTQVSSSTVVSTATTLTTVLSSTTQTVVSSVQSIPTVVYAALAILLILGLIIGLVIRPPR
ncbi:MAG TPA: hypothetical protein VLY21_06600 [Nitrososphaerales archaeon]|nr:hypothetical protein [Nitrososphaerales archaeon]